MSPEHQASAIEGLAFGLAFCLTVTSPFTLLVWALKGPWWWVIVVTAVAYAVGVGVAWLWFNRWKPARDRRMKEGKDGR